MGKAAVPVNMCILGTNLSMASQGRESKGKSVSRATITAIVVGKMVIMPLIGLVTVLFLKNYMWDIPPGKGVPLCVD